MTTATLRLRFLPFFGTAFSALIALACSDEAAAPAGAAGSAGQGGGGTVNSGGSGNSASGGAGSGSGGTGAQAGAASGGAASTAVTAPCGIYIADSPKEVSFVAGLLTTLKWPELEPSADQYDFTTLNNRVSRTPVGQRLSIRMTSGDPDWVAEGAAQTFTWVVNNGSQPACAPPDGCLRAVPWDDHAITRYETFVGTLAQQVVTIAGEEGVLAQHPALESVMLILPGWARIREQDFEVEALPGYSREVLIEATLRVLRAEVNAFPGKAVFTQFFAIEDGVEPPLWEALRDAILAAPELDAVGFYQENMAHSLEAGVEVFRPAESIAAPLATSKEQTFTGLQALTSWADPGALATSVAGGNPGAAIDWALETYGTRYFELYAQDVDAANGGSHPEWLSGLDEVAGRLCQ
jgi:hypothetical protein